jgi:hypothetical protein
MRPFRDVEAPEDPVRTFFVGSLTEVPDPEVISRKNAERSGMPFDALRCDASDVSVVGRKHVSQRSSAMARSRHRR